MSRRPVFRTVFRPALLAGLVALISACAPSGDSPPEERSTDEQERQEASAPGDTAALAAGPRLYAFDCGHLEFASIEAFGVPDDSTDVRELIVPCFVIQHQDGLLLWNTGLPSELAQTEGWQEPAPGTRARLDATLAEQLAAMGMGIDSFDYVAFSHLHFDHVGAANEVKDAVLIIQRPEFEAAFADSVTVASFDPATYAGLADLEHIIIEGDYDVFGDGTVRIISTPGHTPGHQSLFIDLAEYGPIVLSGDLYHFAKSRELRSVPVFNTDSAATRASMARMDSLLEATGAELWIEHELARFENMPHAPDYLN